MWVTVDQARFIENGINYVLPATHTLPYQALDVIISGWWSRFDNKVPLIN